MKRRLLALALSLALPAHAVRPPDIGRFYEQMAITVKPGQVAQFVAGDNVAGYFEGYTQDPDKGAGYVLRSGTFFRNYKSYAGGRPLVRQGAQEQVLPFGHLVRHAGATELDLRLHHEQLSVLYHHRGLVHKALGHEEQAQRDLAKGQELGYNPEAGVY